MSGVRRMPLPAPARARARGKGSFAEARARLRYRWNTTERPVAVAARGLLDGRGSAGPALVSRPVDGDGPSIAYAGLPAGHLNVLQMLERQSQMLVGGGAREVEEVPLRWRDLRRGRFPGADLLVVGGEARQIARLPRDGAYVAPFRVHLMVDTSGGADAVRSGISKSERREYRNSVREHGWELEEATGEADLREFYDRLHMPTMAARHGGQIRTESLPAARLILESGRLFFVREDDRRVAGALCCLQADGTRLVTRLLGVRDGAERHYDAGAFKAMYHLILGWAVEHGVKEVDLFGTEAFVSKGIFQFKRRLGAKVVMPDSHWRGKRIYVRPLADTPALRDFLVANPFLTFGEEGFRPLYFHDGERPARLDVSAKAGGVLEPELVALDAALA